MYILCNEGASDAEHSLAVISIIDTYTDDSWEYVRRRRQTGIVHTVRVRSTSGPGRRTFYVRIDLSRRSRIHHNMWGGAFSPHRDTRNPTHHTLQKNENYHICARSCILSVYCFLSNVDLSRTCAVFL